ncbi:probable G-protein coupled receptor No9 [Parasteatoda tepidariorum]|uniref:probable G-protein coupled receptor No9 n=1 Tax=Parasteatoda tepidariorum TaxID=114398 RepID=UPI00077FBB78|nr:probable G-protein coupled receptor No9 [Parasteatoda tepidariorum]XP_015928139.1 probable G-protein coupled receptor No9 [Parasteatoda tepidariorum]
MEQIMSAENGECPSWFREELINNAKNISAIIILGFINIIIISGNLLVVMAVFASAKLRTVTNFLIVSLAISDLLVGLAVLPYSITLEVLDIWIFGELWCQMWLAVDVWLCTASILNLCAISIDRYLAITRPVHYRAIMSTVRVKLLIASVWVLSFIICFPPLVGWNDRVKDDEELTSLYDNSTIFLESNRTFDDILTSNFTDDYNSTGGDVRFVIRNAPRRRCLKPQCALITNQGYVIYSALGSFYIPMLVMLFFYYRIYVVALKTSRALDRGFRTAKSSKSKGSTGQEQEGSDVTLRIHRGRPTNESMCSSRSSKNASTNRRSGDILVPRRIPTVVYHHTKDCSSPRCFRDDRHYHTEAAPENTDSPSSQFKDRIRRTKSATVTTTKFTFDHEKPSTSQDHLTVSGVGEQQSNGRNSPFTKSKRNARWHAKRFKTEAKATKTVGIIVGGFILCWLPFFTIYLIMGFCETCIPDLLFKVFFYLGYCNSALNPIIYGIISKDFRFAFKKILCRCTLNDDGVASLIRHIHIPTFIEDDSATLQSSIP